MSRSLVLHVFNSSVVSGPETLVIPALSKLASYYEVAVVFLNESRKGTEAFEPPLYARKHGLVTYEIPVRSRWDRQAILELRELFIRLDPKIIHSHEVKAAFYSVSTEYKKAVQVTTNHGVRAKKALKLKLFEWLYVHYVMPKVDTVLTVCSLDAKILEQRGVDPSKLEVHLNGKTLPKLSSKERSVLQKQVRERWSEQLGKPFEILQSAYIMGVVGRLSIEKRHEYILNVLAELPKAQNIFLAIIGRGPLEEQLKAVAKKLGVENRVLWLGYQPNIGVEMAGLNLLLSLSEAEGLPINLIEAAWAKTAILATAIDGILDLIPTSEFGNLVRVNAHPNEVARRVIQIKFESESFHQKNKTDQLQARVQEKFSEEAWILNLKKIYGRNISDN